MYPPFMKPTNRQRYKSFHDGCFLNLFELAHQRCIVDVSCWGLLWIGLATPSQNSLKYECCSVHVQKWLLAHTPNLIRFICSDIIICTFAYFLRIFNQKYILSKKIPNLCTVWHNLYKRTYADMLF